MTVATIIDGMDEITAKVLTVVPLDHLQITGVKPSFSVADLDAETESWARLTIRHATGGQTTLAGNVGIARFGRGGTVTVQCFSPLGLGLKRAYDEAEAMLAAFEGKRTPSDVWFRDCRLEEAGDDGVWQQMNVYATFIYEQRG